MTLLAVDAGGTHTRAACLDAAGRILGVGSGGAGNPTAVGREAADAAVAAAIREALAAASAEPETVAGGAVCAAGVQDLARLRSIGAAVGVPEHVDLQLVGDAVAAYLSVADAHTGIALVVGTGSIAARIEGATAVSVRDGAGWLLGDVGSGFWIGHQVARAVLADLDGRGDHTALTTRVLERVAAEFAEIPGSPGHASVWGSGRSEQVSALLAAVYERPAVELSRFAHLAFAAAGDDAVAAEIVRDGARGVTATLRSARSGFEDAPIAGTGSVLVRGYLSPSFTDHALTRELARSDLRLSADGLVGAAVLALRQAGLPAHPEVRAQLADELTRWAAR